MFKAKHPVVGVNRKLLAATGGDEGPIQVEDRNATTAASCCLHALIISNRRSNRGRRLAEPAAAGELEVRLRGLHIVQAATGYPPLRVCPRLTCVIQPIR